MTALAVLTAVAAAAWGAARLLVPALFPAPAAAPATDLMAAVAWATAALAVLPVALLGPRGVMPTVWGYFLGAIARVVICLLAGAWAVRGAGLPSQPVAAALMIVYLPLLFVEVGLVARYLWVKDAAGGRTPQPGPRGACALPATPPVGHGDEPMPANAGR